jgi:glycoside/pentoside/hexuronide:cation symporter, GPH family
MTETRSVPASPTAPLPFTAKQAFGFGDFGFNLVFTGTGLFLMYVYTDVFGVSPGVAGAIYALALLWDAVTDPVMGVIADRTRTRWGRYRPWVAIGAVPLGLSYVLAYWNPGFTGVALIAWIAFTHCFLRTCYTIAGIPFSSLQARLTNDANERATLAGFRMMGAASGGLAVAVLTPLLVAQAGQGDEARGYVLAAMAAATLTIVILGYVVAATREPPEPDEVQSAAQPLTSDLRSFFAQCASNGPLVRILIVIVAVGVAVTMFSKNILYYFKYVLLAPEAAGLALVTPALMMLLMVPVWVAVAKRLSKRTAWMIGASIAAAGYLAFYLNPVPSVSVVMAIIVLIGLGTSSFGVLFWSMLPDTVEWGQAQQGIRHEAKIFGFAAFAQKAALGLNALFLGLLLEAVGYTANQDQSAQALAGITAIMSLLPLLGVLISVAALWRYPIDTRRHAELRAQIAQHTTGDT